MAESGLLHLLGKQKTASNNVVHVFESRSHRQMKPREWQEKAKAKGLEYLNTDISWLL